MIDLPIEAQNAIQAGADPIEVTKRHLEVQGQAAIDAGADPDMVQKRIVDTVGAMVPQRMDDDTTIRKAGQTMRSQISSAAGGALLGTGGGVTDLAKMGTDVAGAIGVPGASELGEQLQNRQQLAEDRFMNKYSQQQTPGAGKAGLAIGKAAPVTAAVAAAGPVGVIGGALVGAGIGFSTDPGETDTPVADRLKGAAVGATVGAALPAVGAMASGVNKIVQSKPMQRMLLRIPIIGTRGKMLDTAKGISKEVQKTLTKHGYVGDKRIDQVDTAVWTELKGVVGSKQVLPASKEAIKAYDAHFKKLASSSIPSDKSASNLLFAYKDQMNKAQTFDDLHLLKQRINKDLYGTNSQEIPNEVKAEVFKTVRELVNSKLKNTASKYGQGKQFDAANFVHQKKLLSEKAQAIIDEAAESRKTLDLDWMANKMRKEFTNDKRIHGKLAKEYADDIQAVSKLITKNELAVEAYKKSGLMPSVVTFLTGGGVAAGAAMAGMGVGGALAATAIPIQLMSLMVKHPQYLRAAGAAYKRGALPAAQVVNELIENSNQNNLEQETPDGT